MSAEISNAISSLLNGWLLKLESNLPFKGFICSISATYRDMATIGEGSGVILLTKENCIHSVNRVFRVRRSLGKIELYFDSSVKIDKNKKISEYGLSELSEEIQFSQVQSDDFENILKDVVGISFSEMPILKGESSVEQAYIRELLKLATTDDLLGPANGPFEEIVGMSVRDRYLVGKLAPRETLQDEDQNERLMGSAASNDPESNADVVETSTNRSLVPSSLGFTFCVDGQLEKILIQASWGSYERTESQEIEPNPETGNVPRVWRRTPSGGNGVIEIKEGKIVPFFLDEDCQEVLIQGTIRGKLPNGDRLITLFLVNTQELPPENQDSAWIFQPELIVRDVNGSPIFRKKPVLESGGDDSEREALEMIYRNNVEFAVGHGTSVHAEVDPQNCEQAIELKTIVIPEYDVPVTETPGLNIEDREIQQEIIQKGYLDMRTLSSVSPNELKNILELLTGDYKNWIKEQRNRISTEVTSYIHIAEEALEKCDLVLARLSEGIDILCNNEIALDAFRFVNQSMALQRIRSIFALKTRRGESVTIDELDIPLNRSWRPFQLAFVLMSIPSLANPLHNDRTGSIESYADLLWFPTGGGKTEAYLGVAAFAMAIRRLQGNLGGLDSSRGLSVIMRYTLRLLTLQQFQRASTLICAMEVLRRENIEKWGQHPFTIGLWVGQKSTPNSTEESHKAIEDERNGKRTGTSTPAQLTSCPWCGCEINAGRDIYVLRDIERTVIYCGDKFSKCEFGKVKSKDFGLPVQVVDDEIYRRPPSLLIATVDKFAMMAWKGQTRTLFGKATNECNRHGLLWSDSDCSGAHRKKNALPATQTKSILPIRPPDLIIQDEFHLISGPLGTMVGLYEASIDDLCSWTVDNQSIKPKIIASTATVRKASEQVNNVFLRKVLVFPPHGLDVKDNYFSIQRPIDEKPGRKYIGICAPGSSRPAVLIRLYVALLTASQALYEKFGESADPYMTLVGYFNSLRELGGMRRLAEDDVQTRSYRVQMSNISRPGLSQRSVRIIDELTSRVSSKDIPRKLDQLEVKYKKQWERGETRSIDLVLATNMLSVGIDINRLGLMVVNGQPKSSAEYIQATSRVGRSFPGLVCTVLTWSRPRDLSHYETFEHYHATFYKHVEAQSVTPFAPRALDRGLTGALVSLIRLNINSFNPNLGAEHMTDAFIDEVNSIKASLSNRAWKVTDRKAMGQFTEDMISDRIDRWIREASRGGRRLSYDISRQNDNATNLLSKPGLNNWDVFTAPTSMREVEPGVRLVMDDARLSDLPEWQPRPNRANDSNSEEV